VTLPALLAGRRKGWFLRLVGLSAIEALALFAVAMLFRALLIALDTIEAVDLPLYISLSLLFCALLIALTHWGANSVAERLGMDYSNALRLVLLRSCVKATRGLRPQRLGTSMARMLGDLNAVREWVSQGLATTMIASATLLASIAGLAAIDVQLAQHLTIVSLILLLVLAPLAALRLYGLASELRRLRGRLSSRLADLVLAVSTVAYLGRYRSEARRVGRYNRALFNASVQRTRTLSLLTALAAVMVPASVAWVSLLLAKGYPLPMQQPGAWTTLLFTISLLSVSLMGLVRGMDQLINFVVARRRLVQLMQAADEATPARPGCDNLPLDRALSIEIKSLRNMTIDRAAHLQAVEGSTVALVGASGIGKSQLLRGLLQASHDVGEVRVAGIHLGDLSPASLRRAVQWVTPELPLMRGSLRRNLRYAARIKHQQLLHISQLCGLDVAYLNHANGLLLTEAGANLSSSLAARVRLARALATRPGVLLIDDAVFLYDPQAQQALRAARLAYEFTLVIATPKVDCVAYLQPNVVWHAKTDSSSVAGTRAQLSQERLCDRRSPLVSLVKPELITDVTQQLL